MRRRGKGEGSNPVKRADGRYQCTYVGSDGKRHWVYGKSPEDAVERREAAMRQTRIELAEQRVLRPTAILTIPKGPCVYVARDGLSGVLYIGSTWDAASRIGSHTRQPWYPLVVTWDIHVCLTRRAAFDLEKRLLLDFVPPYNVMGGRRLKAAG